MITQESDIKFGVNKKTQVENTAEIWRIQQLCVAKQIQHFLRSNSDLNFNWSFSPQGDFLNSFLEYPTMCSELNIPSCSDCIRSIYFKQKSINQGHFYSRWIFTYLHKFKHKQCLFHLCFPCFDRSNHLPLTGPIDDALPSPAPPYRASTLCCCFQCHFLSFSPDFLFELLLLPGWNSISWMNEQNKWFIPSRAPELLMKHTSIYLKRTVQLWLD